MTETKESSITNSRRPLRKCIASHPFLSITFAGLGILRIVCIRKCSKIAGRPKARGHATTETSFVTEPIWRAACHAQNTHSEEIIRLPANLSSSPPPLSFSRKRSTPTDGILPPSDPPENSEFVLSLPITTSRALQNTCRSACPALPIYSCGVLCIGTGGLYIVELPARVLRA